MRLFRQSSIATYSTCPHRWLTQLHYAPVNMGIVDIAAATGSAVSWAMEQYYKSVLAGAPITDYDMLATKASEHAESRLQEEYVLGRVMPPSLLADSYLLSDRTYAAVQCALANQPLRKDYVPLATELFFPHHGNSAADLIVDSDDGIVVVDYKTTTSITPYMLKKRREFYRTSHQLYFYAMAIREEYQQHVQNTAIALIAVEPKPKLHLFQYEINEELYEAYKTSFYMLSERMAVDLERGEAPMATSHETEYGPCPMAGFCLDGLRGTVVQLAEPRRA